MSNLLLVIFGAGASYDSVDLNLTPSLERFVDSGEMYRPPLARELFDERPDFLNAMNRWQRISMLIPRLRLAARGNGVAIETTLREIQAEADDFAERRSHLMALEFYLREILDTPMVNWLQAAGRATNYSGLFDQLGRAEMARDSLLVTFNYDELIEYSIADVFGWRIQGIDDYLRPNVALIKPHGSVRWRQELRVADGSRLDGDVIAAASRQELVGGEIYYDWTYQGTTGETIHPAIAIPLDRGKTFVCPQAHLIRLTADLEKVTHVLIIGWRAAEQHFLDLLQPRLRKNQPISMCIVDRDTSVLKVRDSLMDALSPAVQFSPLELHDQGFSEFVRSGAVRSWLNKPLETC
jgi:hypothetical protein